MSEEQDEEQKTEAPTGKKLSEARDSGHLPISREVGNWFLFFGILLVLGIMAPLLGSNMMQNLRVLIEMPHAFSIGGTGLQRILSEIFLSLMVPLLLTFVALMVTAIAGTLVQTGFFATTKPLEISWGKLNPIKGLKTIFSKASLVELGKGFLKIVVVGYVAYVILLPYFTGIDTLIGRDLNDFGRSLLEESFNLLLVLIAIVAVIALLDLMYRRYEYFKSLRMTKQEVKDELKQSEGDPMIKMRIRQIRMEKARKRMISAVPKADVVLTNPTHYAVALQYDTQKMNAPTVVAKGADLVAKRIRDVAAEHHVPLVANPPLARALYQTVEVDQEITPEHYRAVAEVISYVFRLRQKKMH
ncbi:MAG: flagellar biosynthesis protein FlhB [Alphaproteobacteria bacterium]